MNETIITGYEDIKNKLMHNGFALEDDVRFVKSDKQIQSMSINGQQISRDITYKQIIEYLGESTLENVDGTHQETLFGFTITSMVEEVEQSNFSVYVRDWDEFISLTTTRGR